jgi:thiopurine S-methyltransferase
VQPAFWQDRWRLAQTAFHQSSVDRYLSAYWPTLNPSANSTVFVPLCGKSLDLVWLRDRGHSVVGVDLSAVALESFCLEHGIPARRRVLADFDVYEADNLRLLRGDFFKLTRPQVGAARFIYDRAALISWSPSLRVPYVEHMRELSASGTQTLLITLEYPQDKMKGPPFSVTSDDVHHLYAADHSIEELARRDILELEPRFKARGLTDLHEVCYRLVRMKP